MTPRESFDAHAQSYIDSALDRQRQLGLEPHLSDEQYRRAVERAADAFAEVVERRELATDEEPAVA